MKIMRLSLFIGAWQLLLAGVLMAQPPEPPQFLFSSGALGGLLDAVETNGEYIYVGHANNLSAYQLKSGQFNLMANRMLPEHGRDLELVGDYLYQNFYGTDYRTQFHIYNLAVSPTFGNYSTSNFTDDKRINGIRPAEGFLYLLMGESENTKINVMNASNPMAPFSTANYIKDFVDFIPNGDVAYIIYGKRVNNANNEFAVLNISNKSNFVELGKLTLVNGVDLAFDGTCIYAACGGSNGLKVIDVSTPNAPQIIGVYGQGSLSFEQADVLNGHIIADASNTFHVVDVSTPTSPQHVSDYEHSAYFTLQKTLNPYVFGINSDELVVYDVSNPASPNIAAYLTEPTIPRNLFVHDNRLYSAAADQRVYIYDISTPSTPALLHRFNVEDVNKAFGFGDLLFAADWNNKTYLYDISQVDNPQLQYTVTSEGPVRSVSLRDDTAYLMTFKSSQQAAQSKLIVLDIANPDAPVQQAAIPLAGGGRDLFVPADGDYIYVAYGIEDAPAGFQILDVSQNPAVTVVDKTITGIPQSLWLKNDLLFLAVNEGMERGEGRIEVYDVALPSNPVLKQTIIPKSGSSVSDLVWEEETLVVSVPDSGIYTYAYDAVNHEFIHGPKMALTSPMEMAINKPANSLRKSAGPGGPYYTLYVLGGFQYQNELMGKLGINIIGVQPGNRPEVKLTIDMQPISAAINGCSINPAAGQYMYPIGSSVDISATDNPDGGWFFIEWLGIGNLNPNVNLMMDYDIIAIALFEELKLTVSGTRQREVYCPQKALGNFVHMLPVTLCASLVDDWTVSRINFKISGTGDDAKDIKKVDVLRGSTTVATGKFPVDNGTFQAIFNPPIAITAGECVTIQIQFQYEYDAETYARDEAKTFLVETENVVAKPVHHESGAISGNARSQEVTIAPVRNSQHYGFAKIQDALNHDTTLSGDSVLVCPGEYHEAIGIDKPVVLLGTAGRSQTFIMGASGYHTVWTNTDNVTIKGFTIRGKDSAANKSRAVILEKSKKAVISENFVDDMFLVGISLNGATDCLIEDNIILNPSFAIHLNAANSNKILDNTFNFKPVGLTLYLQKSHDNLIKGNTGNEKFSVKCEASNRNKFENNHKGDDAEKSNLELVSCENIDVVGNTLDEVGGLGTRHILISNNKLRSVSLISASNTEVIQNTLDTGHYGISLSFGDQAWIAENTIQNGSFGIQIESMKHVEIRKNTIKYNSREGIEANNCQHVNITHGNHIHQSGFWGVNIYMGKHFLIRDNYINSHEKEDEKYKHSAIGVYAWNSEQIEIIGNVLKDNCDATYMDNCKRVLIAFNRESDAFCLLTGFHLAGTSCDIFGNEITRNNGAGILLEDGCSSRIWSNNITANQAAGVHNMDLNVTVSASGNWWGSANGPGPADIMGNVEVSQWLSAPVGLLIHANDDTLYIPAGMSDSVFVSVINLNDPGDMFNVSVQEQNNWMTGALPAEIGADSTSASFPVSFEVPIDAAPGMANQVIVTATSQTVYSVVSDTFHVVVYGQALADLRLMPDSMQVAAGDTVTFIVFGYDQHGNRIAITPEWSATGGTIDQNGRFIAGETPGIYLVTVKADGLQEDVTVIVNEPAAVEEPVQTIPQEYALHMNFPNPFNPATIIGYELSADSKVTLEVFDILGRLVARLVNHEQVAGHYKVTFDGSGLTSGVYVVRMQAVGMNKSFLASKKILLLK